MNQNIIKDLINECYFKESILGCRIMAVSSIAYLIGFVNYSPILLSFFLTLIHFISRDYKVCIYEFPILIAVLLKHIHTKVNPLIYWKDTLFVYAFYLVLISNFKNYFRDATNAYHFVINNLEFLNSFWIHFYIIVFYIIIVHLYFMNREKLNKNKIYIPLISILIIFSICMNYFAVKKFCFLYCINDFL